MAAGGGEPPGKESHFRPHAELLAEAISLKSEREAREVERDQRISKIVHDAFHDLIDVCDLLGDTTESLGAHFEAIAEALPEFSRRKAIELTAEEAIALTSSRSPNQMLFYIRGAQLSQPVKDRIIQDFVRKRTEGKDHLNQAFEAYLLHSLPRDKVMCESLFYAICSDKPEEWESRAEGILDENFEDDDMIFRLHAHLDASKCENTPK